MSWIRQGTEIVNTENDVWINYVMSPPYPAGIWRIDPLHNDGNPYHLLLPDVPVINLIAQPHKPCINVYSSNDTDNDYDTNGYAILEPSETIVVSEKSGMYEIKLIHSIDDYKTQYLAGRNILKIPILYHDEITYQLFRIYSRESSMSDAGEMQIKIFARHIFYDLNDTLLIDCNVSETNGNSTINAILNSEYHTHIAEKFTGYSDIGGGRSEKYDKVSIVAALLGADNSFINRWGGILYRDNYYFSINKNIEYGRNTGVIRYKYNMQEIELSIDYTDVCTLLVACDNFGHTRIISGSHNDIPHHIVKTIEFTYDEYIESRFLEDAQAYFDAYKEPLINVKVVFATLKNHDLYADFLQLNDFEVGDKVSLRHVDLNIDFVDLEIIRKEYDVLNAETIYVEIGNFRPSISRRKYMSETAVSLQSPTNKQLAALQLQLDTTSFDLYVTTPISTSDGKLITTSDNKFILYKKE